MKHVRRNVRLRLVMLDRTTGDLARAIGLSSGTVRGRLTRPERNLVWWSVVLVCPIDALVAGDPTTTVQAPLPPEGWESGLKALLIATNNGKDLLAYAQLTAALNDYLSSKREHEAACSD